MTVVVCIGSEPPLIAICERLVEAGYAPLPATTAEDALRLSRFAAHVELLVIDLSLPADAGLDLLRKRGELRDFPDPGVLAR